MARVFEEIGAFGLFSDNGDFWKQSRHLIAPAFTNARVLRFRRCIVPHILRLRQELKAICTEHEGMQDRPYDTTVQNEKILANLQNTALLILSEIAFSMGHESLLSEDLRSRIGSMFQVLAQRLIAPLPM